MKSHYIQQSLTMFITIVLLVSTTEITNLNNVHNKVKDYSTLSMQEVSIY